MRTLRIPLAIAASTGAFLCATTSFAQDPVPPATTQPTQPAPAATQPAPAQQPVQSVTVQQPPPAVAQAPATTTTTAAAYGPVATDRVSERTIEKRPHGTLLSAGAGLFVLSYAPAVIAGAVSDRDSDKKLFIPVVGPWLDLGERSCSVTSPCGTSEDIAKAMIVTSGIVQGAGVLMAISSLFIPETTSVHERTTTATRAAAVEKPSIRVLPVSFAAGGGLGAVGRF